MSIDPARCGRVFNIQRCSLHDGPGVRTTVFMKGCPLRCKWCQNPEGLSHAVSVTYDSRKCIACGSCGGNHTVEGANCCPTEALTVAGKDYTPRELVSELLEDRAFFVDGGGVTFSGGECLLQSDFVLECAKLLKKEEISVAIDTCGEVDFSAIEPLIPYAQLFLYDIKCIDAVLHKQFTGVTNQRILDNFRRLYEAGAPIWVRVPLIGTFNANETEARSIRAFLDDFPHIQRIEALRYHELGIHKYELLGKEYTLGEDACLSEEAYLLLKNIIEN
ncbi:MAG: glycyl-radical enzyme activating protein [Clostridia bacterium]|nr:glycyl-radical enzyme activating protein [Clostridia bacterium]